MSNPAMPNLPGFGAIAETMEMVRNMWGGMGSPGIGIPGMVMPTLSVEEINKQISDLKAVESWLTLNMNMLRGTIQALEVQSATISTLKSMGETLSASVNPQAAAKPASTGFSFPFGSATPAAPAPKAAAPVEPKAAPIMPEPVAADPSPPEPANKKPAGQNTAADPAFAAPLANPAAWWNMLQDQFKQAVNTAMAPEAVGGKSKNGKPSVEATSRTAPKKKAVVAASRNGSAAGKKPAAKKAASKTVGK